MADLTAADPRIRARKIAVSREAGHRRLRIALLTAAVPAVVAVALLALHSPLLSARHVRVTGATHTSIATVLAVTGLDRHPPLIDVNTATDAAELERLPWVAHASVEPRWPSGVDVHLVERVPVARLADGPGHVAVLDEGGSVITIVPTASPLAAGLVVLTPSGAVPPPGGRVDRAYRDELAVVRGIPARLKSDVVSIATARGEGVVMRLAEGPLAVIGSPVSLGEKMISLATVLARVSMSQVLTIDLRVPAAPVLTP